MNTINGWTKAKCEAISKRLCTLCDAAGSGAEARMYNDAALLLSAGRWQSAAARPELMARIKKLAGV